MENSDIEKERQLFERGTALPAEQWDSFLDAECADDPVLRKRLRGMLDHYRETMNEQSGFLRLDGRDPERIGPYRILQRLGEGGMGIVYAAEQREPVRRRVAIKVLRGGYGSREVLARFDIERQALALMNHAGIARILDAGTTVDHRPYIVMEFVAGEPITQYCERRDLSLEQRLQLFIDVCDAVQHAHQRGIIHRDLKPSNILICEEDGVPVAKVIDFGIAKAITQRLTDQTLETKIGSLLGTPDYMSPEQAELSPLDVDTRTDVYALGAVLYQLLTGVTPLELSGFRRNFSEMQRLINEQVPVPPSQRVTGPLQRLVRGELDWITMKALEKQRAHRYASAADLGRDVRAHMQDDTVTAGPPSQVRKLKKFARRHWLATLSTLIVALVLAVSQIVLVQKNRELQFERDRANEEAEIARRVTQFTASLFELADPGRSGAPDVSARALLDAGVKRLVEQLESEERADVRAALLEAASDAYHGLDAHDEAEQYAEMAVELFRSVDSASGGFARALTNLAHLKREHARLDEAEALGREALAVAEAAKDLPAQFRARTDLADSLRMRSEFDEAAGLIEINLAAKRADIPQEDYSDALSLLGRIRMAQGRFDEAEQLLLQTLALETDEDGELTHRGEIAKGGLAALASTLGDTQRAIALRRELVAAVRRRYGDSHREVATALNNLGFALLDDPQRHEEAERVLLESIAITTELFGPDYPAALRPQVNLAWLYANTDQWEKAYEMYSRVADVRMDMLGADNVDTMNAVQGKSRAMIELGRSQEAEKNLREVLDKYEQHLGARHWRTGGARRDLGVALLHQEKFDAARTELLAAVEILTETLGADHALTGSVHTALQELETRTRASGHN